MTCPGTTSQCNGVGVCQSMQYYALTKVGSSVRLLLLPVSRPSPRPFATCPAS